MAQQQGSGNLDEYLICDKCGKQDAEVDDVQDEVANEFIANLCEDCYKKWLALYRRRYKKLAGTGELRKPFLKWLKGELRDTFIFR